MHIDMVWSLDFDFQFLFSLRLWPFAWGISAFHFWAVLEKSKLITAHCVFLWESDCFKSNCDSK